MNNKTKRRRRIRYSEVHHAYQMIHEVEELRWQVDNLLEIGMITPDDHTRTVKQIDRISEYVNGMIMTLDELQKVLKWPNR